MKINFKLFKQHFLLLISIAVVFASCQTVRMNNFNRQKFTRLKPINTESQTVSIVSDDMHSNALNTDDLQDNVIQNQVINSDKSHVNFSELSDEKSDWVIEDYNSIESDSLFLKTGQVVGCTIIKIDKSSVSFSYDSSPDKTYIIEKSQLTSYIFQGVEVKMESKIIVKEEPIVKDSLSQVEEHLLVVQTSEEEVRERNDLAWRYFLFSLICLIFFAIGIALVLFFGYGMGWLLFGAGFFFVLGLILFSISFIVGYTFLALSAYHSRIYKIIKPEKFAADSKAKTVRTLTILGMLLFGCFPFLIPFAIVWSIVKYKARKVTEGVQ